MGLVLVVVPELARVTLSMASHLGQNLRVSISKCLTVAEADPRACGMIAASPAASLIVGRAATIAVVEIARVWASRCPPQRYPLC